MPRSVFVVRLLGIIYRRKRSSRFLMRSQRARKLMKRGTRMNREKTGNSSLSSIAKCRPLMALNYLPLLMVNSLQ